MVFEDHVSTDFEEANDSSIVLTDRGPKFENSIHRSGGPLPYKDVPVRHRGMYILRVIVFNNKMTKMTFSSS